MISHQSPAILYLLNRYVVIMQPEHTLPPRCSDAIMCPGNRTKDKNLCLSAYLEMLFCQSYMEMFCSRLTADAYFMCILSTTALSPGSGELLSSLNVFFFQTYLPLQGLLYNLDVSSVKHLPASLRSI